MFASIGSTNLTCKTWIAMTAYPPTSALILVAIMPSRRDLEIARLLGWYRVPLKSAPKVIDVDYLAFYQTSAFGEGHRWCIEAVAEVRGHELTTRQELFRDDPDHPRASEEYYKIQIGPVERLATADTGWSLAQDHLFIYHRRTAANCGDRERFGGTFGRTPDLVAFSARKGHARWSLSGQRTARSSIGPGFARNVGGF
jgi:hypothetical protein